jgi:hypothetical protein
VWREFVRLALSMSATSSPIAAVSRILREQRDEASTADS